MPRRILVGLIIILCCPFLSLPQEDELLKMEVSIEPQRLLKGQEGKLLIELDFKEGITINPQPSFTIELIPNDVLVFPKNFFTASDLSIEIVKENGEEHLDLTEPLEILFTVGLEAEKGNHELEGKVKYFARSEKEDWCLKKTSRFKVSFYVRNRTVKKSS